MTPKHVVILAIAGGLMWSGESAWKSYLETQKAIKGIEMQQLAGEQETQRMKIFADAMKHEPHLVAMKADSEEMYNTMLKGAAGAKTVHLPGAQIEGSDARKLVRPTRTPSSEVRLDGSYRIMKIDNSKADHFEVKVNNGDGLVFTAKLDQSVIITSERNKQVLEGALWSRQPVRLMIQGTKVRDEITQATILDVMDKYDKK